MNKEPDQCRSETPRKGFFARLFDRLDQAMKSAAEKQGGCCCGGGSCETDKKQPENNDRKCC